MDIKLKRQAWVDHVFNLDIDPGWSHNILSRIEDCSLRLRHLCSTLDEETLSYRTNESWSIKQHIGHMTDLEALWMFRFSQFEKMIPELVHADMSNQKTEQADHNAKNIDALITDFNTQRHKLILTYKDLSAPALNHIALHPRLKRPMRPVDLLFFVAEHDDHHITSIKKIVSKH